VRTEFWHPTGRREPVDSSPLDTALREAEEEIGLRRSEIRVLAELDPLDTRPTGFRVHPFLACVRVPARWRIASGEIAAVLTPAVRSLAEPQQRSEDVFSLPSWPEPRRVERIVLDDGHVVWGLTLRLLDAVIPRLLAGDSHLRFVGRVPVGIREEQVCARDLVPSRGAWNRLLEVSERNRRVGFVNFGRRYLPGDPADPLRAKTSQAGPERFSTS
jgi:NUDIX domain